MDLTAFRDRFLLPPGVIYFDGNSLGPLPRETPERVAHAVTTQWGQSLIRAWNEHDWIGLAARVGEKIGRLIGAVPGGTIVSDSTSINLFKSLHAAMALRPDRNVILTEAGNFPTDLYIAGDVSGAVRAVDDPVTALDADVAVLMLTHVNYRTGAMHDMRAVTEAAHRAGALVVWDLSHSAGAVPLHLAEDGVDFAVGCGYKYLNGGPGAPAFLSVASGLRDQVRFPISGWLGHADPFAFEPAYRPAPGVLGAVVGTPPILSLVALEAGVDLMLEASMEAIRARSLLLTDAFLRAMAARGFRTLTPADPARRGSQVSFAHPEAHAIVRALIARGVIGDFRAPDVMRFGLAPLYNTLDEVNRAMAILDEVMAAEAWRDPEYQRKLTVT